MESTSGTPLGMLHLDRQRPSVWCYSGRIERTDIIGLGKSSKFQWSWWGSQTENENRGFCIFSPSPFIKNSRKVSIVLGVLLVIFILFLLSLSFLLSWCPPTLSLFFLLDFNICFKFSCFSFSELRLWLTISKTMCIYPSMPFSKHRWGLKLCLIINTVYPDTDCLLGLMQLLIVLRMVPADSACFENTHLQWRRKGNYGQI